MKLRYYSTFVNRSTACLVVDLSTQKIMCNKGVVPKKINKIKKTWYSCNSCNFDVRPISTNLCLVVTYLLKYGRLIILSFGVGIQWLQIKLRETEDFSFNYKLKCNNKQYERYCELTSVGTFNIFSNFWKMQIFFGKH